MMGAASNVRPAPDRILSEIADYVSGYVVESEEAYETARYCLMDSIGCGLLALRYPECAKLNGPVVPGATLLGGARAPGTQLKPGEVTAAEVPGGPGVRVDTAVFSGYEIPPFYDSMVGKLVVWGTPTAPKRWLGTAGR